MFFKNFIKNKKGMEFVSGPVLNLLIAIAVLVLIAAAVIVFKNSLTESAETDSCRLSVLKASIPGSGVSSFNELTGCQTSNILIEEVDPDIIQEDLVSEVYTCWEKFYKGKINFMTEFSGPEDACFICSRIRFAEPVSGITPSSLQSFIRENEVYNKYFQPLPVIDFKTLDQNNGLYAILLASARTKTIQEFSFRGISEGLVRVVAFPFGGYTAQLNSHVLLVSKSKLIDE